MSTLYIRLPPKVVADSTPRWLDLDCPFALVAHAGAIEREGVAPLSELSETIAKMQRVVLLLAAGDVTVLRLKIPPLSAGRLKAALPSLVEEFLLCDPADCVIVSGGLADGMRTIAVAQRSWIELLAKTFTAFGARHITVLPAQSCLSYPPDQPGMVTAAIYPQDTGIDLTLRLSEHDGSGLMIDLEKNETAAHQVIQTLCALVPAAPITLYVPQASIHAYQEALADMLTVKERISILGDSWTHWIDGARGARLDFMAGRGANTIPSFDWHVWRWPLVLATAVLLVNVSGLNIDWWGMKSEANSLRSAMVQTYKSAYPSESVIIDPIAQMQQKIAAAQRDSGLAAADDFTSATAAFGEAWASVTATLATPPAVAALEYRDRSLFVRLRGREAPTQQMQNALAKNGLALDLAPEQSGALVWKIRSAK